MGTERRLAVGDDVWLVAESRDRRRIVGVVAHTVVKVGRKFYTLNDAVGRDAVKLSIEPERGDRPGRRYYSPGYGGGRVYFFDRQDAEDSMWFAQNHYRLEKAIRECRDTTVLKRVAAVLDAPTVPATPHTCHICFGPMVERTNSTTGLAFWGCANWPACKGARNLDGTIGQGRAAHPDPGGDYPAEWAFDPFDPL